MQFRSWSIVGVFDTLSDSIQCLNFAKKWFIQYSIQYRFTQDSIQNIIQFKINSGDSIQNIIVGPIGYRPIPGIFSFSFSFFSFSSFSAGKRLLL